MIRVLFIFLLLSASIQAQEVKEEIEKKIDPESAPQEAVSYIQSLKIKKRGLRYYIEQDNDSKSFEAKFKNDGKKYSIEFDQTGNLQDVEVLVEENFLEDSTLENVKKYIGATYERFKIEKIQAQYLPMHEQRAYSLKQPDAYELIVAIKNEKNKLEKYEMTFNPQGTHLKSRKIVRRSYDFLIF